MNWKKRYNKLISSPNLEPKIGMKVKGLKSIEGNESIKSGIGKITVIEGNDFDIGIDWDATVNGYDYMDYGNNIWFVNKTDWNNGTLQIL